MIRNLIRHDVHTRSNLSGRLARKTCPEDLPGRLARQTCKSRQTCLADLPGRLARQTCPADLLGRLAQETCLADLPGKLAMTGKCSLAMTGKSCYDKADLLALIVAVFSNNEQMQSCGLKFRHIILCYT
jgi:hypothetical protein